MHEHSYSRIINRIQSKNSLNPNISVSALNANTKKRSKSKQSLKSINKKMTPSTNKSKNKLN
jgi:hypothetical protein